MMNIWIKGLMWTHETKSVSGDRLRKSLTVNVKVSPMFFSKVLGRHDTEAGSVIWEMTDSRAGGGVACRHPGGSATLDRKSCLERLKRLGCFVSTCGKWL